MLHHTKASPAQAPWRRARGRLALVAAAAAACSAAFGAPAALAAPPDRNGSSTVAVTLSAPGEVIQGEQFEYVATVSAEQTTLEDVRLSDTLPAAVRYVSARPDRGTCSVASGTVSCALGRVDRRTSTSVRIAVVADSVGSATNAVAVTATAGGGERTGGASVTTTIAAPPSADPADLQATLVRDPGPAMVGAPLTYRATITNTGPAAELTVAFFPWENWTYGYAVLESFKASHGRCTGGEDLSGTPVPPVSLPFTSAFEAVRCDLGVFGTGQTFELTAVVRMSYPTSETEPLYTTIGTVTQVSSPTPGVTHVYEPLATDRAVVTTGSALVDCSLTTTGNYTNVAGYLACATAP